MNSLTLLILVSLILNEGVKKIHIQNVIFFTHEKGIYPAIGDNMNEP